jgi:hypothetical protein
MTLDNAKPFRSNPFQYFIACNETFILNIRADGWRKNITEFIKITASKIDTRKREAEGSSE